MQKDNKNKSLIHILLTAILVVCIIFFGVTSAKLRRLQENINYLQMSVADIINSNSIEYNKINGLIQDSLDAQLYLSVQPEWESEYKEGEIVLNFSAVLSQSHGLSDVYIYYKDKDSTDWRSEKLKEAQGLNYKGTLTLEVFKKYEYYVLAEGEPSTASKIEDIPAIYYYISPDLLFGTEIGIENSRDSSATLMWRDYKESLAGISYTSYNITVYHGDNATTQTLESLPEDMSTFINFEDFDGEVVKITVTGKLADGKEITRTAYERGENEEKKG